MLKSSHRRLFQLFWRENSNLKNTWWCRRYRWYRWYRWYRCYTWYRWYKRFSWCIITSPLSICSHSKARRSDWPIRVHFWSSDRCIAQRFTRGQKHQLRRISKLSEANLTPTKIRNFWEEGAKVFLFCLVLYKYIEGTKISSGNHIRVLIVLCSAPETTPKPATSRRPLPLIAPKLAPDCPTTCP